VDRIHVGNVPTAVAFGFGSIWVTNAGDQSVTRLDARTGRHPATIPTGDVGRGITVGGDAVWVSDDAAGRVSRIDPRSNQVTDRIGVGNGATGLAYGAGAVWVANRLDGTVSRIDPISDVATTLTVGGSPAGITVVGREVWVSDESGGRILRIDPRRNRVVASVKTGNRTEGITLAANRIWVAVQAAGRPHRGGTLRIISTGFLGPLDPNGDYSVWNLLIATNDGLTAFKRVGGVDGSELVPDLATSLPKPSDGGRTYVFRVRTGIRYSNGRIVRPADFRYSLERLFALHSVGTYLYAGIRGAAQCERRPVRCDLGRGVVTDDDAGTVTFHLVAPDPDFPDKLALPFVMAVPVGTPMRKMIVPATGPYVIASYAPTRQLELQRNPRFREWSKAAQPDGYPDEVIWKFVVKDQPKVTAVERGEADWLADIPPRNRLTELRTQYASQLNTSFSSVTQYLFLNTRLPPFNDIRIRKAFALAVDRQALSNFRKVTKPLYDLTPSGIFPEYDKARAKVSEDIRKERGIAPDVWAKYNKFDAEQARKTLTEAGFPVEKSGSGYACPTFPTGDVSLMFNTNENNKAIAEFVQAQWRQNLGVTIPLKSQEFKTFLSDRHQVQYSGFAQSLWSGDYMDPYTFLGLHYGYPNNGDAGFNDPKYNKMLDDANAELDPTKRYEMLARAEFYLMEQQPSIPLTINATNWMKKPYVKGMYPNPGTLLPWKFVYIEQDPSNWDTDVEGLISKSDPQVDHQLQELTSTQPPAVK